MQNTVDSSKVIFLDVDGVLNDAATEDRTPDGFIGLSDAMISNLERIVKQTNAKVVLVSTWKSELDALEQNRTPDGEYLDKHLKEHGIMISDKTIDRVSDRGNGIVTWLKTHPEVKSWIVLDDDVFFDYHHLGIMPHLIRTRYCYGGLTYELADQAIAKLNDTGSQCAAQFFC